MKQNPDIVLELQDIAPTLASLQGRGSPFTIPQETLKAIELSEKAKNAIDVENLVFGTKSNVWAVPENYWLTLNEDILNKINSIAADEIDLARISKVGAFTTPENYFEPLADLILDKVKYTSLPSRAQASFTTPNNYFENLESQLFTKIKEDTAKAPKKIIFVQWRRIAVAAVLTGVIFSAIWFLRNNNTPIGVSAVAPTAMNEQQVQEYVQEQATEADIQNMVEASEQENIQEEDLQKLLSQPKEQKTENKKAEVEEYISNEIDESALTELL